jgi:AcrR family transcriptional regulator
MRILDAEGLDAVTMRRVAVELDTGPASLYAHVKDKHDLYGALVDRVLGEIPLPEPDPAQWQEQLKDLLRQTRAALGRHRDIARASLGSIPVGDSALPAVDRVVGIVLASGVTRQVAAWSVDILNLYVTATAFEEALEDAQSGSAAPDEALQAELATFFSELPAARFPHLVAMAGPLTSGDRDERFEFGLDLLVRGIASTVVPVRRPRGRRG